jgi:hypothetical protein
MTYPLRAPHDTKVAKKVGEAFRKVFENIDQIDVEKILAAK